MSKRILIAGASGYIGRALIPQLLEKFPDAEIIALSRGNQSSTNSRVKWMKCDLFSLKSLEEACKGGNIDLAYYLVHSMSPTARLDQGNFADYDLILADNFARFCKTQNFSQLIYLGGLLPDSKKLSLHMSSRLEMEEVFNDHKLPLTTFRAGLILGASGSSSQILFKLVNRLPVMLCPKWTHTLTSPVSLPAVVEALGKAAFEDKHRNKTYDLAECGPLPYVEIMRQTAFAMKKKRHFFKVPFFTPTLSRLWVSLITQSPKELVYPLVDSLKHPMVARECSLFYPEKVTQSFSELISRVPISIQAPSKKSKSTSLISTVRSVQRLDLPKERTASWATERYLSWLPSFFRPFFRVLRNDHEIVFLFFNFKSFPLLKLHLSKERSSEDRQLLYITGGLLAKKNKLGKGRLEFREVLHKTKLMAAIHDFVPSLPWYIYKYSQAKIHAWVMFSFGRYLRKK